MYLLKTEQNIVVCTQETVVFKNLVLIIVSQTALSLFFLQLKANLSSFKNPRPISDLVSWFKPQPQLSITQ